MTLQQFFSQYQYSFSVIENYSRHHSNLLFGAAIAGIMLLISLRIKARRVAKVKKEIDFQAIAGDDVMTTQLDLARAYLEMDQQNLAKTILEDVLKYGNAIQKEEARNLIKNTK